MSLELSEKTQKFTREVKQLVESGVVSSYAQVAADLNWNRTALSQVLAGTRNVPATVYRKFTEVYKRILPKAHPEETDMDHPLPQGVDAIMELQGKYIALLESKVNTKEDALAAVQSQIQELQRYLSTTLQEIQLNRAFAKVCYLALQKIRSAVERQPLEVIEADMDKDLAAFAEEYLQKGN